MNKYQALAVLSPYGLWLRGMVDDQWPAWEDIVRRMNLPHSAEYIYAEAVWGLGLGRVGRSWPGLQVEKVELTQLEMYMLDSWLERLIVSADPTACS